MENLRSNYRYEEDEEDSEPNDSQSQPQHNPRPVDSNNNNNNSSSSNNENGSSKQEELEDAEENGNNEEDDDEGDDADEDEDDPQAPNAEKPPLLPVPPSSDETDDDDDDGSTTPARKKQRPLSSFTSPSPSQATAAAEPPSATMPTAVTPALKKPKKKTKAVNVWTKSTSRKGKKKSKPASAGNQESSVLIAPVPRFPDRSDDSPDMKICLSKVYKAEKVELSDDRLSAGSTKGYRMVRATRGVVEGAWYFEIKVVKLGETGHTRLGWSTEKGDLQAPVGYDGNSFGYRDVDGSKVHRALRERYGEEGYVEGDVVGCYINLPEGGLYAPKPLQFGWYKGQKYAYAADGKEDPPKVVPGSEISFFKNGVCQGVAFKDLCGGRYYPAASMYTLPNQPNCVVKFNFGPDFEFFPKDFDGRPTPTPMIEVPYHGYDGRVEGIVQNGLSAEKKH